VWINAPFQNNIETLTAGDKCSSKMIDVTQMCVLSATLCLVIISAHLL
jgi:hypothetical protein